MPLPGTVIFWGAGATASLGIRTTAQQAQFIQALGVSESNEKNSLPARVKKALDQNTDVRWVNALTDLLAILGDEQGNGTSSVTVTQDHIDAMRRNWKQSATDDELRKRILELRSLYDWPSLKAAIRVCPGVGTNRFELNDLLNILELHGQSSHGFRVKKDVFLAPQQIIGALNTLKLLLHALFYLDWTSAIRDEKRKQQLQYHVDFAEILGHLMQCTGIEMASAKKFDSRDFYMGAFTMVSLNYDPVGLWCQYIANRSLNRNLAVPYIGSPARKIQIFNDLGQFVAGQRIEPKDDSQLPWFPMNETAVQRLNEKSDRTGEVIRISKFLLPHGCVCWRECPDCGKLSSYMGSEWSLASPTLIPPPPLKAFAEGVEFKPRGDKETKAWNKGIVDARECVYCGTLTYAHHTQTIVQTNFKQAPPPVLEEIQRDMRIVVQSAEHIVLMGYSLPPDDVLYRAFFAARQQRDRKNPVRCSVVVGNDPGYRSWLGPSEWPARLCDMKKAEAPRSTLEAAGDIFGKKHVRFYGGGVPNVFLEDGQVTEAAVNRLLEWDEDV